MNVVFIVLIGLAYYENTNENPPIKAESLERVSPNLIKSNEWQGIYNSSGTISTIGGKLTSSLSSLTQSGKGKATPDLLYFQKNVRVLNDVPIGAE